MTDRNLDGCLDDLNKVHLNYPKSLHISYYDNLIFLQISNNISYYSLRGNSELYLLVG